MTEEACLKSLKISRQYNYLLYTQLQLHFYCSGELFLWETLWKLREGNGSFQGIEFILTIKVH